MQPRSPARPATVNACAFCLPETPDTTARTRAAGPASMPATPPALRQSDQSPMPAPPPTSCRAPAHKVNPAAVNRKKIKSRYPEGPGSRIPPGWSRPPQYLGDRLRVDRHPSTVPASRRASRHHRAPVRAINDGVSANGVKADVRWSTPEFRLLTQLGHCCLASRGRLHLRHTAHHPVKLFLLSRMTKQICLSTKPNSQPANTA